jgi:hypothetical protein
LIVSTWRNKIHDITYELIIDNGYAYVVNKSTNDFNEFQNLYVADLDSTMYKKQVAYNWFETQILPVIREKIQGEHHAV